MGRSSGDGKIYAHPSARSKLPQHDVWSGLAGARPRRSPLSVQLGLRWKGRFYSRRKNFAPSGVDFESVVGSFSLKVNIRPTGVDFNTLVGCVGVTETFSRAFIGHDATSSFLHNQSLTNPQSITRGFTFNNSNFSARVTRYPQIKQSYKNTVGAPFNLEVENASKLMNTIIEDRTLFRRSGAVTWGYQTTPYSADVLTIGTGVLTNADYKKGKVTLNFRNKLSELAETPVS